MEDCLASASFNSGDFLPDKLLGTELFTEASLTTDLGFGDMMDDLGFGEMMDFTVNLEATSFPTMGNFALATLD